MEHPELGGSFSYPGSFVTASETPIGIRRRAPLIGEHNHDIYGELGFSTKDLIGLKECGVI